MRRASVSLAWLVTWLAAWSFSLCVCGAASAESVESFYAGKTVRLLIGFGSGGGYDVYGRILARHLGRHIPGNPTILPQNMAGAGSLRAAGYIYNVAPKDGTVIGTVSRGIAADSLLGTEARQFDSRKFTWIGSVTNEISLCAFSKASGIQSWKDVLSKPSSVGSSGSADDTAVYANVVRNIFHAPMKLISGYPGTNEILLAVERNELSGLCGWSWSSLKSRNRARYEAGDIVVAAQLGLTPHEELPNVPLIMSLTKDATELAAMRVIFSRQTMARPFLAPPDMPDDRKQALRAAFDATMKDPEFLAEAQRLDLEVRPVSGTEIEALVTDLYKTPEAITKVASEAIKSAP
jgi:tripartite-type tricarboxylate transporter receptor subunit TctC